MMVIIFKTMIMLEIIKYRDARHIDAMEAMKEVSVAESMLQCIRTQLSSKKHGIVNLRKLNPLSRLGIRLVVSEYTVFAGLEECIRFIANFKCSKEEITFLRETLSPTCEDGFFDYLQGIDFSDVEVYAIPEGSVVFPKYP
ncbi:putative nicotinate phosphoribosyltransferase [Helianthus anomalus]